MDKQSKNILIGVIVVAIAVGVYFMVYPDGFPETPASVVGTTQNVGTIGNTAIICPEGFTVISTVGGTVDTVQEPLCKAPNPSLETFACGDSVVDVEGMVHTIECSMIDSSNWSRP